MKRRLNNFFKTGVDFFVILGYNADVNLSKERME